MEDALAGDLSADVGLRADVLRSLRMVTDPELGESLVDLGLIYQVEFNSRGGVHVVMSTAHRGASLAAYLRDAVHSAVWIVPGVELVEVDLTYDPPWSPEMMDGAARLRLGAGSVKGNSR